MPTRFTHLHTHTHYSLLDGLSKIDDLIELTKKHGMDSVAITDHGVMYGAIEFYQKAKKAGIKPIIGCEMYIVEDMKSRSTNSDEKRYNHLILLAKNDIGYKNLIKLVTTSNLEGFYYKPRIDKNLLRQHSEGLICLSGCLGGEISQALLSSNYEKAKKVALEYSEIFGKDNYYIEIQQHANLRDQNFVNPKLIELSRETGIPLVATQDSHYLNKEDTHAHDVLLAVQTGNKITDTNRFSMRENDLSFLSGQEMAEKFKDTPEAITNASVIADQCNLEIKLGEIQLPQYVLPDSYTAESYLDKLCQEGVTKRYGTNVPEELPERLAYELGVIKQTGFASYFLIVQDLVNWAKQNGIIVGPGRGSAAGSIVTYLLSITNLDPLAYGLIFERFLNPERISMPDIDIDFDDARRGEVMDYVRQKYGTAHFAQIITFGTMAARGSVRDAGRALGYPYELCDKIAKLVPFNPNAGKRKGQLLHDIQEVAELKQAYQSDPDIKTIIDTASRLEGVARHCSTHACAVVITPKPLTDYLPLQKGTNEGDIITQYEMHAVEDLGLLKMDFLGLSNLTIIEDTLKLIHRHQGIKINIDDIPLDDKKTFQLFQKAQTTGVFQLESSGMKRYLKTLKPNVLEDIIVMIALYRPGPLDAGTVDQYIERKHGRQRIEKIHPIVDKILANTYGVIVYQEQVMDMATELAGLTRGEGYLLIKAVGKKIKSLLDEQKERFINGCEKNNIPKQIANRIWDLIEPFARYGFNKAHSACYALIGYQTAYLKAHYPNEFMAAWLNSASGDIERTALLIEEAQTMGAEVLPPSINESFEKFAVVGTNKIRFGLSSVKNVGVNIVQTIVEERNNGGQFKSIGDFVTRVKGRDLNKKSLESLIKCGGFDDLEERSTLLYNMDNVLNYAKEIQRSNNLGQASLFGDAFADVMPSLRLSPTESSTNWEKLLWEKELLGLFVSEHPMKSMQSQLKLEKVTQIKDISGSGSVKISGMVTKVQKILTKTGKPMIFSWLEDMTSKIEVVVFPNVLEKNPEVWQENNILIVRGKLNDRDGVSKILCDDVRTIATLATTAQLPSAI